MHCQRLILMVLVFLFHLSTFAQQAQPVFANIDGCGSNDGNGEYLIIYSGGSGFTANSTNIAINYFTGSTLVSITDAFESTRSTVDTYVSSLEALLPANCINFISTIPGDNIPAGSHILVVNGPTPNAIDFSGFCSANEIDIHVMISTDASWSASGRFANNPGSTPPLRRIDSNINGNATSFSYQGSGWQSISGGNYLQFDDDGTVNYGNYSSCNINNNEFLPVSWLSFTGNCRNGITKLVWETAGEENNNFFTVERSENAEDWESLDYVTGSGTTSDKKVYSYIDRNTPLGRVFYKIKQTDFGGTFDYSEVISVLNEEVTKLKVYPNPTSDHLSIESNQIIERVYLLDMKGKKIEIKRVGDRFDVSYFKPGAYRILIVTVEASYTKNILVH